MHNLKVVFVEIPMLKNNKVNKWYKYKTLNKHVMAIADDKVCKHFHVQL